MPAPRSTRRLAAGAALLLALTACASADDGAEAAADASTAAEAAASPVDQPSDLQASEAAGTASGSPSAATSSVAPPQPSVSPAAALLELQVQGGQNVGGIAEVELGVGEQLRVRVIADVSTELHVHGVDAYLDTVAGESVEDTYVFPGPGRFEVEDHSTGAVYAFVTAR